MKKVDLVYILGTGSKWDNNEIKYSLRSVEKHLRNFGKVYVIGEKPEFLKNIVHIPCPDEFPNNKEGNIAFKIKKACETKRISEDFLFLNDDHFFLQDFEADKIPYFYRGHIHIKSDNEKYRRTLINTLEQLAYKRSTVYHFDVHTPIIYNKEQFLKVLARFDWYNDGAGFLVKSLYCNMLEIPRTDKIRDLKFRKQLLKHEYYNRMEGRPFFSIADEALNDSLKEIFEELYPDKSRFEK